MNNYIAIIAGFLFVAQSINCYIRYSYNPTWSSMLMVVGLFLIALGICGYLNSLKTMFDDIDISQQYTMTDNQQKTAHQDFVLMTVSYRKKGKDHK